MPSVQINGEMRDVSSVDIASLLTELDIRVKYVVVERNGEAVYREKYPETAVTDGDVLEIVQPMSGG